VSVLSNSPSRKFPILCYVTGRHSLRLGPQADARAALLQKIAAMLSAGIGWVQIREKDLPATDLAAVTRDALALVAKHTGERGDTARILVNDRLDIALTERAAGVHLGESSLPVSEAKRLVELRGPGRDFSVGASCHSLASAKSAQSDGADYIIFGPVFETPSKAAFGATQGLDRLAEACQAVSIPVLAIGGITLDNARSCFAAGAAGIAAIRLFQDSPDPDATIEALRQIAR
jgi:thiamine-phosphate pyrophosphorylase